MSQHRVDITYVYTDTQGNEFVHKDRFFSEEAPVLGSLKNRQKAIYIPEEYRALYVVTGVEEKSPRHFAVVARSIASTECDREHKFSEPHRGSILGKRVT